jgi:hypothetical protein
VTDLSLGNVTTALHKIRIVRKKRLGKEESETRTVLQGDSKHHRFPNGILRGCLLQMANVQRLPARRQPQGVRDPSIPDSRLSQSSSSLSTNTDSREDEKHRSLFMVVTRFIDSLERVWDQSFHKQKSFHQYTPFVSIDDKGGSCAFLVNGGRGLPDPIKS